MNRRALVAALLVASTQLAGCYTVNMQVDGSQPVMLADRSNVDPNARYFRDEGGEGFLFWGLVGLDSDHVRNVIAQNSGGRPVVNVRVQTRADIVSYLLGVITLGIYTTRTIVVEGSVR